MDIDDYKFVHVKNSINIRKLTLPNVMQYKPKYTFFIKESGAFPEIVEINSEHKIITIQHENDSGSAVSARSENIVRSWLKKGNPWFNKNRAFLIINNTPNERTTWVVDYNCRDERYIEYHFEDIVNQKVTPSSVVMVSTDFDYPIVYYEYYGRIEVDAIRLYDLFKGLSYTNGIQSTTLGTKFMSEFIIEAKGLKINSKANEIFLEELAMSDYLFYDHITTEAIQGLFHGFNDEDDLEFYYGFNRIDDEFFDKPTLKEILYGTGLKEVTSRYVVENDIGYADFSFVVANPRLLYVYCVFKHKDDIEKLRRDVDTILANSVLKQYEYSVIIVDEPALQSIKNKETVC